LPFVYRTADGKIFDLVGIPPDIEVPVFADADVTAGKDLRWPRR
jgi:hypothetical protein